MSDTVEVVTDENGTAHVRIPAQYTGKVVLNCRDGTVMTYNVQRSGKPERGYVQLTEQEANA